MNALQFIAVFVTIALATVALAMYENAIGVPFDSADLGKALIFIVTAGAIALLFLTVTPKKS